MALRTWEGRMLAVPVVLAPWYGPNIGGGGAVNVRFIFNGNARQRRKMARIYKSFLPAQPGSAGR